MIGKLEWDIRAASTTLPVLSGNVSIDDQNVPAITADIVVPYDAVVLDALDPRVQRPPRVVLNGTLTHWQSLPVSAITDYLAENTITDEVADVSALWSGKVLWEISELFGRPLWSGAADVPGTMSLDLGVRELVHDEGAGTMTVSLASDEALLIDWAVISPFDVVKLSNAQQGADPTRTRSYVDMFTEVVLGVVAAPGPYDTQTVSGDFELSLVDLSDGVTAWEGILGALDDGDLKLRVNPSGKGFTLQRPENSINNPATHSWLFRHDETLSAKRTYSRTGDWYDSALLRQDGVPAAGYPTGSGSHTRTYQRDFGPGAAKPNVSMALNIVRRSVNRGLLIDLTVPTQFKPSGGVFMRDEFTYENAEGDLSPWIVKSVNYDIDQGVMSIRGEQRY